ncbi:hypothetical protein ACLOJK_005233 [Asimina triloba]
MDGFPSTNLSLYAKKRGEKGEKSWRENFKGDLEAQKSKSWSDIIFGGCGCQILGRWRCCGGIFDKSLEEYYGEIASISS